MAQNEVAVKENNSIAALIKTQIPAIQMAVAGGTPEERQKRAERFARVALTTIRNSPQLMQCNQASVVGGADMRQGRE
jgi:recombinational DNA repair protein RecT